MRAPGSEVCMHLAAVRTPVSQTQVYRKVGRDNLAMRKQAGDGLVEDMWVRRLGMQVEGLAHEAGTRAQRQIDNGV